MPRYMVTGLMGLRAAINFGDSIEEAVATANIMRSEGMVDVRIYRLELL